MLSTIYRASFAYYPLLVDMRKDEALNIIYDMFKVMERIKFSLRWTQDIPLLNRSSRLLFTLTMSGYHADTPITIKAEASSKADSRPN